MQYLINWSPLVGVTGPLETTSDEVPTARNEINSCHVEVNECLARCFNILYNINPELHAVQYLATC